VGKSGGRRLATALLVAGALAVPGGIPTPAAAAPACPTAADLLAGLRAEPLTDEAAGNPAVLESVSCALPWATAVVPAEGEYDASFVLFRYEDAALRWKPLNVGSGGVCDESVPADIAGQLNGCADNDDSGDELPDEDPVEEPEGPVNPEEPQEPGDPGDPEAPGGMVSTLAASQIGGSITRDEIMDRAQGWVNNQPGPYSQRAFSWDPTQTRKYRRDCSGLVGMAWHLNADPSTRTLHQYSNEINKQDLRPGDILNTAGKHVVLFKSWKTDRRHFTYYTFGSTPVKIRTAAVDSGNIDSHRSTNYVARRYTKIVAPPAAPPSTPMPARPSVSGDVRPDLLVHGTDGVISVRYNQGTWFDGGRTRTQGWSNFMGYNNSGRLYFADINNDRKTDLLVHGADGVISVRYNKGTYFDGGRTITQGWSNFLGYPGKGKLYFADINGDGRSDLLVHGTDGVISVRYNKGTWFDGGRTLTQGWSNFLDYPGKGKLYFADINADSKADLLVHGTDGVISVRYNKGTWFDGGRTLTQGWSNFMGEPGKGRLYFG
jgi:ribosomal protein L35AE/L33A